MLNTANIRIRILLAIIFLFSLGKAHSQTVIADAIPTSYDVSSSGAFTYVVPLRIPPGIKDMMPQLAISYNSQSGNGNMGMGWNITGLSSITSVQPDIYHDQKKQPLYFNTNGVDAYMLDGQRLILDYGISGVTSQPELKNFTRVEQISTSFSMPYVGFKAVDNNNVTYEFGNSTSSQIINNSDFKPYIWLLNKVYDTKGNYMEFLYDKNITTGEYHITHIHYGGNSLMSLPVQTSIDFYYETNRTDVNVKWFSHANIKQSERLSYIEIKTNSILVNKYQFTYEEDFYSHLTEIKEIRPTGELPPIEIEWGNDGASTVNYANMPSFNTTTRVLNVGDFDGDGFSDVVSAASPINGGAGFDIYMNQQNKTMNYSHTETFANSLGTTKLNAYAGNNNIFLDYNGDGLDDMITITTISTTTIIYLYKAAGGGYFSSPVKIYENILPSPLGSSYMQFQAIHIGDYDGDGRKELLICMPAATTTNNYVSKYYLYIIGQKYPTDGTQHPTSAVNYMGFIDDPLQGNTIGDYDGDGRDELYAVRDVVTNPYTFEIYKFYFNYQASTDPSTDPNPTKKPTSSGNSFDIIHTGHFPTKRDIIWATGDFNGDGLTDLLTFTEHTNGLPNDGKWQIAFAKGQTGYDDGFDVVELPSSVNIFKSGGYYPTFKDKYSYYVYDFNGDGKSDIMQVYIDYAYAYPYRYIVWYSKGYNLFEGETGEFRFGPAAASISFGDFNGDGAIDIIGLENGNMMTLHDESVRHMVTSIKQDDYELSINYRPVTKLGTAPVGGTFTYPFVRRMIPIYAVSNINDYNGLVNKNYKYTGLIYHSTGLGFRGFQKFEMTDYVKNRYTESFFNLTARVPYLTDVNSYDRTTLEPISAEHNEMQFWIDNTCGGYCTDKIILAQNTLHREEDFIDNTNFTTTIDVGSNINFFLQYGEPASTTKTTITNTGTVTSKKFFTYTTFPGLSSGLGGVRVASEELQNQRDALPIFKSKTGYTYNSDMSLATETNNFKYSTGTYLNTTSYTYDSYGNIVSESLQSPGITTRTTNYTYSYDSRFITHVEKPYGYTLDYTYNKWGVKLSEKLNNQINSIVTYEYDPVNRLIKTTRPTGVVTDIIYDWAANSSDKPMYGLPRFSTTTTVAGITGSSISFNDVYGRILRKRTVGFNGQGIYHDTHYSTSGMVEYQTAPYAAGSSPLVQTNYTYDNKFRILTKSITGGKSIDYTYTNDGLHGTKIRSNDKDDNIYRTSYYDATGSLIKVDEGTNNTIQYALNSNQQATKVTINGNASLATTYTYDEFGRASTESHPSSGTITYTYNNINELYSTTYANGMMYHYTYDDLGRLIKRQRVTQITPTVIPTTEIYTYTYENTPGLITTGTLKKEALQSNSSEKNYTYDAYGRQASVSQLAAGITLTTSTTYDAYSRPQTITYPNNDLIEQKYNSYGYFYQVDLVRSTAGIPAQTLWKITGKNTLGQTTTQQYFNASSAPIYTQQKDYSDLGFLQQHTVANGPDNVVDMTYTFDEPSGNLTNRQDNITGINESFTYDSYDRLTEYNGLAINTVYDYSAEGNMNKKTDITQTTFPFKHNSYKLAVVPDPASASFTLPQATQTVTYTPFQKVASITEGNDKVEFGYGADDERTQITFKPATAPSIPTKIRYYSGNYERTQDIVGMTTEEINYVMGDEGPIAILYNKGTQHTVYYTITDYQGSFNQLLDNVGSVNYGLVEDKRYDPWGRPMDANGHYYPLGIPAFKFDRGYTGHEHLNRFNVINMNSRLYDPLTGRMYSPDPYLPDDMNTQAYNKYSYCNNNPTKYIDPDGHNPVIIVNTIMGGIINVVVHSRQISSFGDGAKYFLVGALSSLAGNYIGVAFRGVLTGTAIGTSGFVSGAATCAVGGFSSGFIAGSGNTWTAGGSFKAGLTSGLKTGYVAGISAGVTGGFIDGISSLSSGGNFFLNSAAGASQASLTISHAAPDPVVPDGTGYGMMYTPPGEPTSTIILNEIVKKSSSNVLSNFLGLFSNVGNVLWYVIQPVSIGGPDCISKAAQQGMLENLKRDISRNQIRERINKGQKPKRVLRLDNGNPGDPNDPQDHIHFDVPGGDKNGLYRDGTWKHGPVKLFKEELEWLKEIGWGTPVQ